MQFSRKTYIKIISFGGLAALILADALFLFSRRQSIHKPSRVSNEPPANKFSYMLGQLNTKFMLYYEMKAMDRESMYKDRKLSLLVERAFAEIIQTEEFQNLLKEDYIRTLWRGDHFVDPWVRPLRWTTFMKPVYTSRWVNGKEQNLTLMHERVEIYSVGPHGMEEPNPHDLIAR